MSVLHPLVVFLSDIVRTQARPLQAAAGSAQGHSPSARLEVDLAFQWVDDKARTSRDGHPVPRPLDGVSDHLGGAEHEGVPGTEGADVTARVVVERSAAGPGVQDGPEAGAELAVEEGVEDGVDAGVGSAEPLGEGKQVVHHPLVHPGTDRTPQLDPGKDGVQGQPGTGEQHDHHEQHLDHLWKH